MAKILVTGASGLLGSRIVTKAEGHEVFPTHATRPLFPKSVNMNVADENGVKRLFDEVKPDVTIHTAAETNVDKCEANKSHALRINAEGTKILAEACNSVNARMIYVSTDYVFDGEKGFYVEEDAPNPINHYGLTKLMGEKYVKQFCEGFVILRTSVLYGAHIDKPNFASWVIAALKNQKSFAIVEDHYNSPTLSDNLAEVILEVVNRELDGLFHVAGSERINRYDFAVKIAETFDFDTSLIRRTKMSQLKAWTAKRPKDSSLCVDKIRKEIDTELLGVTQGLREMRRGWVERK